MTAYNELRIFNFAARALSRSQQPTAVLVMGGKRVDSCLTSPCAELWVVVPSASV